MANTNLVMDLTPATDRNGKIYYVAKIKVNALLDLSKGATFLVFTSDAGNEQLQIAPMENKPEHEKSY